MINYILADYKRILTRVPRIIFLVLFEAAFVGVVLHTWKRYAGNYTSVSLMDSSFSFFGLMFTYIMCLVDFIQGFSFDFRAKTIQVALGIGVSRMKVIIAKLIQITLVMLTDLMVTLGVLGVLSAIVGVTLVGHQISYLLLTGLGAILLVACSVSLLLPLVFRTQSMLLAMIGFVILVPGFPSSLIRMASSVAPLFIQRLQLDQYAHDNCVNMFTSNLIQGSFQLWPFIGVIAWFALGIYLTWLAFRKMELDF